MQISAPQTATASRPYVKLNDVGDSIVIAIGHVDTNIQETDYETQQPKTWDDGNPVLQTRITGVVMSVNGNAVGRQGGDDVPLSEGDEVAIFVSGGKNGNQGRYKAAAANGIELADVMQYRFDRTEPASKAHFKDRKIHETAIRTAKPEELDKYKTQCDEIWRGFQDVPQVSAAQAVADTFGGSVDTGEDPF